MKASTPEAPSDSCHCNLLALGHSEVLRIGKSSGLLVTWSLPLEASGEKKSKSPPHQKENRLT